MVSFFKHDIPAWRGGTGSLTFQQYRIYHTIIEQIMLEEGPIVPHEKALAGTCNTSTRMFRKVLGELLELGKLQRGDDGKISNGRARSELVRIELNRENASKGGRTLHERSTNGPRTPNEQTGNANDTNGAHQAPLDNPLKHKDKTLYKKESKKPSTEELAAPRARPTYRTARQTWEADLARELEPNEHAEVINFLATHPDVCERATAHEQRNPGTRAGALAALTAFYQQRQPRSPLND